MYINFILTKLKGPTIRSTNFNDQAARASLSEYMSQFVTSIKPRFENEGLEFEHPSMRVYEDKEKDLYNLVNQLQQHSCREDYCQLDGECRFSYPKPNCDIGKFDYIANDWHFFPKRNSPVTVPYNPDILRTWRSNIDLTVISSTDILTNYVTKYVTKSNQSDLIPVV